MSYFSTKIVFLFTITLNNLSIRQKSSNFVAELTQKCEEV